MRTLIPYEQPLSHGAPAAANGSTLPAPDKLRERCQAMLFTLAELGADFARQIHANAAAAAELPGVDHGPMLDRASQAFDRTTTGVRRTILLIDKLAQPAPSAAPAPQDAPCRSIARDGEAAPTRPNRVETLRAELHERLEAVERPESLGARPIEQIVAGILADLGLAGPGPLPRQAGRQPSAAPWRCDPAPDPLQRTLPRVPAAAIPDG